MFWVLRAAWKKHTGTLEPKYLASRLALTSIQICYYLYPLVTGGLLKIFRCMRRECHLLGLGWSSHRWGLQRVLGQLPT